MAHISDFLTGPLSPRSIRPEILTLLERFPKDPKDQVLAILQTISPQPLDTDAIQFAVALITELRVDLIVLDHLFSGDIDVEFTGKQTRDHSLDTNRYRMRPTS